MKIKQDIVAPSFYRKVVILFIKYRRNIVSIVTNCARLSIDKKLIKYRFFLNIDMKVGINILYRYKVLNRSEISVFKFFSIQNIDINFTVSI